MTVSCFRSSWNKRGWNRLGVKTRGPSIFHAATPKAFCYPHARRAPHLPWPMEASSAAPLSVPLLTAQPLHQKLYSDLQTTISEVREGMYVHSFLKFNCRILFSNWIIRVLTKVYQIPLYESWEILSQGFNFCRNSFFFFFLSKSTWIGLLSYWGFKSSSCVKCFDKTMSSCSHCKVIKCCLKNVQSESDSQCRDPWRMAM